MTTLKTIIEDNDIITAKGTILILFSNTVKINNTIFVNRLNNLNMEAHPPKLVLMTPLNHETKVSLPYLHKLNIENTNLIQDISEDLQTNNLLWWVVLSIVVAVTIILLLPYICKKEVSVNPASNVMSMEELRTMLDKTNSRVEDEST